MISYTLILWLHVYIKLFFLMLTILSLPFFIRRSIYFLGIHFWILSTICPDGCCPHFCEAGTVGLNVTHLSTFIACHVHAIAFPLRWSQQRFLSIAQLCQAISYLNSLLFRFWCIVHTRCLHTMHYVLSSYDGPWLAHWRLSFICSGLCVACCCVCVLSAHHIPWL